MKKHFLNIALIFLTAINISNAQVYTACFNADVTKGCAPLTVTMNDCSGSPGIVYNFGLGEAPTNTHTYTTPGIYSVTQTVDDNAGSTSTITKTNYIQVLSATQPDYTLAICAGRNVTLTVTDNDDTSYAVYFGEGPTSLYDPNVPINFTYTDTLPKTINITPWSCGLPVSIPIYPLGTLIKPDVSSLTVNTQANSNGEVTLNFNALINHRYYLQQSTNNNTSYTNIDTLSNLSGVQNLLINNLNTTSNQYCYRLVAYDDCNPPIYSEEICSTIITPVALNNQNQINWSAHIPGNVNEYYLFRDGLPIDTLPAGTTSSTDLQVNCGVNYCYHVVADLTNNLQSISDQMCVTAISTNIPTAIQNLNSTVNGNSISLSWNVPVGFSVSQYRVLRSENGGVFGNYGTSTTNNFSDNSANIPGNTYCYIVNYTDICNNASSPGPTTCPVILNVTVDNSSTNINYLSWSAYTGSWPSGVEGYRIERLDENNNVTATINVGLTFSFTDIVDNSNVQIIKYRIKAIANGPDTNTVSYSNIIEIKYEGAVFLPNAFTPDGDGTNDSFMAKGKFIKDFKMIVFNRWGEVVFSADRFDQGWDGAYMGAPANVDAYAWLIEATDFWGKNIIKRGSVTLLR